MNMTLIDYHNALDPSFKKKRGVIQQILKKAPWMGWLKWEVESSLIYTYNKEGRLPALAFRGLNSPGYADGDTTPYLPETIHLKPWGGKTGLDRLFAQKPDLDKGKIISKQVKRYLDSAALDFGRFFIESDVKDDAKSFNGLIPTISALNAVATPGKEIDLIWDNQVNGALVNDLQVVIRQLSLGTDRVFGTADVCFCPQGFLQDLEAATSAAGNNEAATFFKWKRITLMPGIDYRIGMWQDTLPLIPMATDSQDDEILDYDETVGASNDTASLYFLKMGEGFVSPLSHSAALGPDVVMEGIVDTNQNFFVDWATAVAVEHKRAAVRIRGIRKA